MSTDTEELIQIQDGLLGDIIKSIMTPGYTANGVIRIMHYAFYALFATLASLIAITGGNPHVIALFLLSLCLFVTIRWFIAELEQDKANKAAVKAD